MAIRTRSTLRDRVGHHLTEHMGKKQSDRTYLYLSAIAYIRSKDRSSSTTAVHC
ncbi:MAG TPA: hypothetical protein V6D12_25285 [Candidatus Obscuribacterales bacterium]